MSAVKKLLAEVRDVIGDPAHWCRDVLARDRHGDETDPYGSSACRWCLEGAILKAARAPDEPGFAGHDTLDKVHELLQEAAARLYDKNDFVWVNDNGELGHDAVIGLINHAVRHVEDSQ